MSQKQINELAEKIFTHPEVQRKVMGRSVTPEGAVNFSVDAANAFVGEKVRGNKTVVEQIFVSRVAKLMTCSEEPAHYYIRIINFAKEDAERYTGQIEVMRKHFESISKPKKEPVEKKGKTPKVTEKTEPQAKLSNQELRAMQISDVGLDASLADAYSSAGLSLVGELLDVASTQGLHDAVDGVTETDAKSTLDAIKLFASTEAIEANDILKGE